MAFPTSPTNGQTATVNGITYTYNSTDNAWYRQAQPVGNLNVAGNVFANIYYTTSGIRWTGNGAVFASGGGTYTANTAPPTTGNVTGDQWYNTSSDILYEYIDDGTNKYWVDIISAGNVTATAVTSIGNATLSGNISPLTTTTFSIGAAGNTLKEVHTQALYENGARLASTGKAIAMAIVFGG